MGKIEKLRPLKSITFTSDDLRGFSKAMGNVPVHEFVRNSKSVMGVVEYWREKYGYR